MGSQSQTGLRDFHFHFIIYLNKWEIKVPILALLVKKDLIKSSSVSFSMMGIIVKVAQLCPTLCNPMDNTVHGILQARIQAWVAFPFQGILPTQGLNPGLLHCRWILYQLSHKGNPRILEWVAYPFSRGSSRPRN